MLKLPATALLVSMALSTQAIANEDLIINKMNAAFSQSQVMSAIPIDNGEMYEVEFFNGDVVYATPTGNFFVSPTGDLWSIKELVPRNLTTEKNLKLVENLKADDLIVYQAPNEKVSVTVFTDVDCTYCRKLHSDIDKINALGITVKYAAFPRGGMQSPAYSKMVDVWCSDNRKGEFSNAKSGLIPTREKDCLNPVLSQWKLGKRIGVTGTPTLVSNGRLFAGYQTPERLAAILGVL